MILLVFLVWALWVRYYRHRPKRVAVRLREFWQIRRALRAGQLPETMGQRISVQKVWRVGAFIVKTGRKVMSKEKAGKLAAPYEIRLCPSVREGKWLIQLYYRPGIPGAYQRHLKLHGVKGDRIGADMHDNNVGVDTRDRWVAFDW